MTSGVFDFLANANGSAVLSALDQLAARIAVTFPKMTRHRKKEALELINLVFQSVVWCGRGCQRVFDHRINEPFFTVRCCSRPDRL
jgi:hypothetical protein